MNRNNLIALAYLVLAPFAGGLLTGMDRLVTARMQRRKGPPILQPFYDVAKFMSKRTVVTNRAQLPLLLCYLVFTIFTGMLFFDGTDLLLTIFVLTAANAFLVLAAFSSNSPSSFIGAERELAVTMAYEPMVILTLVGFYKATGSFRMDEIIASGTPLIALLPGIFLGYVYVLTMKLHKSPFDIAFSHHAHQELSKGLTSDFSGRGLAMLEIAEWYEKVFLLGFVYLFFAFDWRIAIPATLFVYFLEILVDNASARLTWRFALKSAWIVALVLGIGNLIPLYIFSR